MADTMTVMPQSGHMREIGTSHVPYNVSKLAVSMTVIPYSRHMPEIRTSYEYKLARLNLRLVLEILDTNVGCFAQKIKMNQDLRFLLLPR